MKIKAFDMIKIWNVLDQLFPLSDDPVWTGWVKRVAAHMRPETEIWNSYTEAERKKYADTELSFSFNTIPAQHLPGIITAEQAEVLKPVVSGEIKPYKPQLPKK